MMPNSTSSREAVSYIVGRVEAGEFGLAIAYSSVLIAVMLVAILVIQLAVGERRCRTARCERSHAGRHRRRRGGEARFCGHSPQP